MKLIFANSLGIQDAMEIGEGGGCNDKSQEIWNEFTDGSIPKGMLEHVGSLRRVPAEYGLIGRALIAVRLKEERAATLVVDEAVGKENARRVNEIEAKKFVETKAREERQNLIRNLDTITTVSDLKAVLKAITKEMNLTTLSEDQNNG